MPTVTLCMIVCDEEEQIGPCLSAARPYVDEIIVVDTGSQDRTIAIAEQNGAKVYRIAWNDHFAEARNYVIKRAHSDWILVLDADERLSSIDPDQFKSLLTDDTAVGYYVTIRHLYSDQLDDYETDSICRLFRNLPDVSYRGRIHEDIGHSLSVYYPHLTIKHAAIVVNHYGYLRPVVLSKEKAERNRKLLERAVREEHDQLYYRYALGVESFLQENYAEAATHLAPLLPLVPPSAGFADDLAYKLAYASWRSEQRAAALQAAETGLIRHPSHGHLQELHGILLLEGNHVEEAYHRFQQLNQTLSPSDVKQRDRLDYWRGVVHERLGNWHEALTCFEHCIQSLTYHEQALSHWLDLALLLLPADDAVARLQTTIPGADKISVCKLLGPHAVKFGIGTQLLPVLEEANANTEVQSERGLAFYEAIMRAQNDDMKTASEILQQLVQDKPEQPLIIYLWALQNTISETFQLDLLYRFKQSEPELTLFADGLLRGQQTTPLYKQLLEQALYATLILQGWPGFLYLWQQWTKTAWESKPTAIPKSWRHAIYRSPIYIREIISQNLNTEASNMLPGDQLFSALLSYSIGNKEDSLGLLNTLREQFPQRLEPRIALYGVHRSTDEWISLLLLTDL